MSRNEWYQIGEEIKKQVQQAIDANDFTQLSKTIGETVGQAVGDVGKSINDAVNDARDSFQQGMQQAAAGKKETTAAQDNQPDTQSKKRENPYKNVYYPKPNVRPNPQLFNCNPEGSVSGILWMIVGFGMTGLAGLSTIHTLVGALMGAESFAALSVPLVATTAGVSLGAYGTKLKRRVNRFRRYVGVVKEKLYCSVEELAQKTGKSQRFVRKDLKKMIQKGMFLQAHLDKKESCLIASDAMYEQYMLAQNQYEQQQTEQGTILNKETGAKKADAQKTGRTDDKVLTVLEEGRAYIRVIRSCNDEIPGEEMSEKLDKLELLVTRIFAQVEKEPELAPELQKMLSYYLPTTQKLLEAYRDLDKQNVDVKNISDTKREIEMTVDTINGAFEKFLDELFRDKAWDIQSDISVLNTMLKQDGYLKTDFEQGEKK